MSSPDVFDALADPTRRQIIERLVAHPGLTATAIAGDLPVTRQAVAKHLGVLRDAGLADVVRDGREARYSFTPEPLGDAMAWMVATGAAWDRRLERLQRRSRTS